LSRLVQSPERQGNEVYISKSEVSVSHHPLFFFPPFDCSQMPHNRLDLWNGWLLNPFSKESSVSRLMVSKKEWFEVVFLLIWSFLSLSSSVSSVELCNHEHRNPNSWSTLSRVDHWRVQQEVPRWSPPSWIPHSTINRSRTHIFVATMPELGSRPPPRLYRDCQCPGRNLVSHFFPFFFISFFPFYFVLLSPELRGF
jgi:hypothetical protein